MTANDIITAINNHGLRVALVIWLCFGAWCLGCLVGNWIGDQLAK